MYLLREKLSQQNVLKVRLFESQNLIAVQEEEEGLTFLTYDDRAIIRSIVQ